jgi:serine/threonine protein kinase
VVLNIFIYNRINFFMEFIGEGSYGCVVKPGEKCYKKIKKNIITKIFIEKDEWKYELKNYEIINKILKKEYIVKKYDNCVKKLKNYNNDVYLHCSNINSLVNSNTNLYQISYEYGGIDLDIIKRNSKILFKEIFKAFASIFETIYLLDKNDYIHQDIRNPNILYNTKNKHMVLIDYGFLIKKKDFFSHDNNYIFYTSYHYAPEINFNNYSEMYSSVLCKYYDSCSDLKFYNKLREETYKNIYEVSKKKYKIYTNKLDIYMMGIILLQNYLYYHSAKKMNLNKEQRTKVENLIENLLKINSEKRYSPKKALDVYLKICKKL